MYRDKKLIYISSVSLTVALLLVLFFAGNSARAVTALILAASAVAISRLIKKRAILSINKNEVLGLMALVGALFVMIYFLTGLKFGFYRTLTPLSLKNLIFSKELIF